MLNKLIISALAIVQATLQLQCAFNSEICIIDDTFDNYGLQTSQINKMITYQQQPNIQNNVCYSWNYDDSHDITTLIGDYNVNNQYFTFDNGQDRINKQYSHDLIILQQENKSTQTSTYTQQENKSTQTGMIIKTKHKTKKTNQSKTKKQQKNNKRAEKGKAFEIIVTALKTHSASINQMLQKKTNNEEDYFGKRDSNTTIANKFQTLRPGVKKMITNIIKKKLPKKTKDRLGKTTSYAKVVDNKWRSFTRENYNTKLGTEYVTDFLNYTQFKVWEAVRNTQGNKKQLDDIRKSDWNGHQVLVDNCLKEIQNYVEIKETKNSDITTNWKKIINRESEQLKYKIDAYLQITTRNENYYNVLEQTYNKIQATLTNK